MGDNVYIVAPAYYEEANIKEVLTIDGKWAIVSEYIKGKTLAQLMEENPEEKEKYMKMFIKLQIEICSNKCTLFNLLHIHTLYI